MIAWLIEIPVTGVQALYYYESHMPHRGGGWTTIVHDAFKFETEASANEKIASWSNPGSAKAMEHEFV